MNVIEYYVETMEHRVLDYRDYEGISYRFDLDLRLYKVIVRNEEVGSDSYFALLMGLDLLEYQGILLQFNGELHECSRGGWNVWFKTKEDVWKARNALAAYLYIEKKKFLEDIIEEEQGLGFTGY